ncbi:MAG: serine/threonine protein kinase, partial [Anaerolineae bacterium]|nr:serine/threonine protein kinase [Anaerolineae bacterium]
MTLASGVIVGERYRVVHLLGKGGMGAVYRAWDTQLNRPVALKEMLPQPGLESEMLAQLRGQFRQEAQVLAALRHPALVRVTDYFSWMDNEYLVMDFVEGESLMQRIARQGAQPEGEVLVWAAQLLDALAYCHSRGVIHRDVKPHNIIITPQGRAVLVDFGLVKLWNPDDPQTRTVMRGAGTPEYAPPEQYETAAGHTDPRSDIYSLGATLYHALTGKAPPTATQRLVIPSSLAPPRLLNTSISPNTEAAIVRAMEIAKERRFQSAREMAQALLPRPVITPARATPEPQPPTYASERAPTGGRHRPAAWLVLGGLGLILCAMVCLALGIGIFMYLRAQPAKDGTPTPTSPSVEATIPQPGTVIFEDDFASPTSGWEIGDYGSGSVGYADGTYFVLSSASGATIWGVAHRSFDNLILEVDTAQVSAGPQNNNDYGVICREQGNGDGYYFLISGNGSYAIFKSVGNQFTPLVDWSESSVIRRGNADNRLKAICNEDGLVLIVNGQPLASARDSTYTTGDIALTATTYEDQGTEIHFDNLVVYSTASSAVGQPSPSPKPATSTPTFTPTPTPTPTRVRPTSTPLPSPTPTQPAPTSTPARPTPTPTRTPARPKPVPTTPTSTSAPPGSGVVATFLADARRTQRDLMTIKVWFDRLAGGETIYCSTVYAH